MKHKNMGDIDVAYMHSFDRETKKVYAKVKQKNEESLTSNEKDILINETVSALKEYVATHHFNLIITPESSNVLLSQILSYLNLPIVTVSKQDKLSITNTLNAEKMCKTEKEKLTNSLVGMSSVKMAQLSGNQRKRVAKNLFNIENVEVFQNKNILFFDDALFTGSTLSAIQKLISFNHAFVMFSFD